jgi:hypothetical protein
MSSPRAVSNGLAGDDSGGARTYVAPQDEREGEHVQWTMSREAEIRGPISGQVRPPATQWLLTVVTLGVYAAIRHRRVNRELRDFGVDVDPLRALLAFFPGMLLGVPFLVTVHRTSQRVRVAQETVGLTPSIVPWRTTVLSILAFAHVPFEQAALNTVWHADTAGPP